VPEREEQIAAVLDVIPIPATACSSISAAARAPRGGCSSVSPAPRARPDLSPPCWHRPASPAPPFLAGLAGRRVSTPVCSISRTAPGALSPSRSRFRQLARHPPPGRAGKRELFRDLAAALAPEGRGDRRPRPAGHPRGPGPGGESLDEAGPPPLAGAGRPSRPYEKFLDTRWNLWAETDRTRSTTPPSLRSAPLARGGRAHRRRRLLVEGGHAVFGDEPAWG